MGKKFSIDHFISEGEKRTAIYDKINRFDSGKNAKREETSYLDRYAPRGISEPFVMASGNAVDQFVYRDSCLTPRLLPFIKKNHSDRNYIFWPDQTGCHYAEHSLVFLCENLIHLVDKVDNLANLPEVRPIEDFWSILKAKVYENNWKAKTLHQLEVRIKKCLKEVLQY